MVDVTISVSQDLIDYFTEANTYVNDNENTELTNIQRLKLLIILYCVEKLRIKRASETEIEMNDILGLN